MLMKKPLLLLVAALLMAAGSGQSQNAPTPGQVYSQDARQALRLVGTDLQNALIKAGLPADSPIAVLPVKSDPTGYVLGLIKTAVTGAGLHCVEGKEDEFVQEIWHQVEWDERKDDILDTNTIAKFGQVQGAKLLLYAKVIEASGANGRGYAEIEVHVSSIETARHLWSQDFARRFYDASLPVGPLELRPEIRAAIQGSFSKVPMSLKAATKLRDIHSVLLVPLAGDADQFVTGLAQDALSSTPYVPKQLDVRTLGDARALLRDDPKAADAILYGSVRDFHEETNQVYADHIEFMIYCSVQLTIQASPAGDVLWSDTIETMTPYPSPTKTNWEMSQQYAPSLLLYSKRLIVPAVVVIGLFLLFRAMRRTR